MWQLISREQQQRLIWWSLMLNIATLPWAHQWVSSAAIALSVLALVLRFDPLAWIQQIKTNKMAWLALGFYAWLAIAGLWTSNMAEFGWEMGQKLGIALIPLAVWISNHHWEPKHVKPLKWVYVAVITGLSALSTGYAFVHYFSHHQLLFYQELFGHWNLSPVYMFLHGAFCFFLAIDGLNTKETQKAERLAYLCVMPLWLSMMVLCAVKFQLIAFCLVIIIIGFRLPNRRIRWAMLASIAALAITTVVLILVSPAVRERFTAIYQPGQVIAPGGTSHTSFSARYYMWQSAKTVIASSPIWGQGTGDMMDALYSDYNKVGFSFGSYYKTNAHNQYLQIWGQLGLVGLAILVLLLLWPVILANKAHWASGQWIFGYFMLTNLTECMLNTHSGLVLFGWLVAVLALETNKRQVTLQ